LRDWGLGQHGDGWRFSFRGMPLLAQKLCLLSDSLAKVENTESRFDAGFSTRRAKIPFFEVNPAVVSASGHYQ
jgi:hypothetical protein